METKGEWGTGKSKGGEGRGGREVKRRLEKQCGVEREGQLGEGQGAAWEGDVDEGKRKNHRPITRGKTDENKGKTKRESNEKAKSHGWRDDERDKREKKG